MTNFVAINLEADQVFEAKQTRPTDVQILDAIAVFVCDAKLKIGDKLPPERELVQRLQVSRNTLREALKRWETLGIIKRRKGSGTYLTAEIRPGDSFLSLNIKSDPQSILNTLEIRRTLESEAGALAAIRATAEDLGEIEKCIDEVERVHHLLGGAGDQDWEFHCAIYRASHNPIFEQIVSGMHDAFHAFFEAPAHQDFADGSLSLHRDLFNAIKAKNPELARSITHQIIDISERDVRRIASD
ncbi:MAG: FadR family transcriptional regulator [Oceanospirillaceae bacterium]|nr:FadR family transcriptional regulator [Oceanospirillaceae bacterium]